MKHTLRTALLALLVTAGITLSARAEMLFPTTAVYTDSFVDVQTADWFYPHVATLYELGLTNGKGDSAHFEPYSDLTVAEAVTLAARLRSLYDFGESETGAGFFRADGEPWYASYYAYLRYSGVIDDRFTADPDLPATRAEVAHLLANVLPDDVYEELNTDRVIEGYASGQYIRDVDEYTPYYEDILALYRRGILSGMDSFGSFEPDSPIRRSEIAAMLTRITDTDLRITLQWEIRDELHITSLAELVENARVFYPAPHPTDRMAVDSDVRYMLSRGERAIVLDYGKPQTKEFLTQLMDAFLTAIRRYPEQTYNKISLSYSTISGKVTVRFSSSLYGEEMIPLYREDTLAEAIAVRNQLYAEGALRADMSQYDKAKAYFLWLCSHCDYDYACSSTGLSHSAYGAFRSGLAVCDGYTAAYNLLLRLEGIACYAIDREDYDHMWTVAVLDGTTYHIDPTWGDQTATPSEYYFGMTEAQSLSRFQ